MQTGGSALLVPWLLGINCDIVAVGLWFQCYSAS